MTVSHLLYTVTVTLKIKSETLAENVISIDNFQQIFVKIFPARKKEKYVSFHSLFLVLVSSLLFSLIFIKHSSKPASLAY